MEETHILSPNPSVSKLEVEQTEKQLWEVIKSIPGLNVTYGTVRCLVYVIKKDEKEVINSAVEVAKGLVQTAAISAAVFAAPVTITVAAGVLTGVVAKSVTETAEVLVFFVTHAEQFQRRTNDEREQIFYNKMKRIAGVGAVYSAVRLPIYLLKRNKQQSIKSGLDLVTNSGDTAVQVGIGMIPSTDDKLQKLIHNTVRFAIKSLSKKVLEQVSQQTLPSELALKTIAQAENDCQQIMETTFPVQTASVSTTENPSLPCEEKSQVKNRVISNFFSCFSCKVKEATTKSNSKLNEIEDEVGTTESIESSSNGHILVLTD